MTHEATDLHATAYQLHCQGHVAEAVPYYRQAIELEPGFPQAWSNLGLALLSLRQQEDALGCQRQALLINPGDADAQNNLGMTHYVYGHLAEAENAFRAALRLDPGHANATLNLGTIVQLRDQPQQAEVLFRHALGLGVDVPRGQANLAMSLLEQVRPAEAEQCCREALAVDAGHAQARANLALALLMQGRLAEGWRAYESRWEVEAASGNAPTLVQPRWTGQPLNGETVLLWAEQGFGDVLQFCRYVPLVARAGGRVVLVVPSALKRLMASLDGVAALISEEDDVLPPFDYHCPLLSLPFAFNTTLETIPAADAYLHGDPTPWADLLAELPGLRVGLVWAGRSRTEQPHAVAIDKRRSMRLSDMLPLLDVAGCSFVSLQLGPPAAQLRQLPSHLHLWDVSHRMTDWAATAGLIAGLDLVITVDTAVAHLAAALGRPVWMLNRFDTCWRWMLDRRDTPWYPTMHLFRQERRGDWSGVIAQVATALAAEVASRETVQAY